jgi:hypothetical protein
MVMRGGTVFIRDLRWSSVVVAVWLLPWGAATATPDVTGRPATLNLSADRGPGLVRGATRALVNPAGSGRLPSPDTPVLRAWPKQFFRVSDNPVLSVSERAQRDRQTCPNEELARRESPPPGPWAVERCVLLCRFLL